MIYSTVSKRSTVFNMVFFLFGGGGAFPRSTVQMKKSVCASIFLNLQYMYDTV
uniref:Uncharacterized protein n=1 Tax=Octopus bimaculoides TaxID=37653 RepID=A0A0L8HF09_OCTBM